MEERTNRASVRIVYPKERFVTYACVQDVSDEVLYDQGEHKALDLIKEQATAQARHEAQKIDTDAPLTVTLTHVEEQPRPNPFVRRWRIYVCVEFQTYYRVIDRDMTRKPISPGLQPRPEELAKAFANITNAFVAYARYERLAAHLGCNQNALFRAVHRGRVGELDALGITVSAEEVAACWEGEQFYPDQLLDLVYRRYLT